MANVKTYKCDICGKVYHDESWDKNNRIVIEHWVDDEKSMDIYNHACTECVDVIKEVIHNPDTLKNKDKAIGALQDTVKKVDNDKYTLVKYINAIRNKFIEPINDVPILLQKRHYYGVEGCEKAMNECFDEIKDLKESKRLWKSAAILLGTWGLMAFILLWFI